MAATKLARAALRASAATAAIASLALTAHAADTATVVGAGPGAGAYQQAGAFAENINRLKLGLTVTNRASKGFVANTRMVETGGSQFAWTNGVFVHAAQTGGTPFKELKATNIRGIGPVTTSWFQMAVLKSSGIKTYMDLKGKRVNYAAKGSSTEFMTKMVFEKLGLQDGLQKEYMRWDQAATAMTDGNIDAFGIPNPVPSPSILQASASAPLRILSLPKDVIEHFVKFNPGYYEDKVPPGSYAGMEKEGFDTVAYTIFITANAKVSDDIVYKATKATYDEANRDFIIAANKSWKIGLDSFKSGKFLEQMKKFNLALHPGAAKYWKERGILK